MSGVATMKIISSMNPRSSRLVTFKSAIGCVVDRCLRKFRAMVAMRFGLSDVTCFARWQLPEKHSPLHPAPVEIRSLNLEQKRTKVTKHAELFVRFVLFCKTALVPK